MSERKLRLSDRMLYSPKEVAFARHVLVQMRDVPPTAVPDEPPLEIAPRVKLPDAMYEQAAHGVFDMTLPLQGAPGCRACGGQGVTPQREWCVCAQDYPETPPWPQVKHPPSAGTPPDPLPPPGVST